MKAATLAKTFGSDDFPIKLMKNAIVLQKEKSNNSLAYDFFTDAFHEPKTSTKWIDIAKQIWKAYLTMMDVLWMPINFTTYNFNWIGKNNTCDTKLW